MALNLPASPSELLDRILSDIQAELPEANPYLKNEFLNVLATAFAGRIYDFYTQLQGVLTQAFPDTATDEYLERWGSYVSVSRLAATKATGSITVTGTLTSSIPISSQYQTEDGTLYITQSTAVIAAQSINVSSMTRSGSTVTVTTTTAAHNLASNMFITIAGANETGYNGSYSITVTGLTTFTYQIATTPSTPATGTITVSYNGVSISVEAETAGKAGNSASGTTVSLLTPISGVDQDAYVQYSAIGGGTDTETDAAYRSRILDKFQKSRAPFSKTDIEAKAKEVAGVTRVFVAEYTPYAGAVTVYFLRDNDESALPDASEITTVKTKLLTIKPASMEDDDLVVAAPTALTTNFTFTALDPNTTTMQAAIQANLEAFFNTEPEVGEDLPEAAYLSAIYQTVDLETGSVVKSFTLSAPSADISVADDEIPILGTVTFS